MIFTDDQGYADVSVFGAKGFSTPNIDKLADEGMRDTTPGYEFFYYYNSELQAVRKDMWNCFFLTAHLRMKV